MIKKKKTTKYDLSRNDIVVDLNDTIAALEEIDYYNMSPNDLSDTISGIVDELSSLRDSVTSQAE